MERPSNQVQLNTILWDVHMLQYELDESSLQSNVYMSTRVLTDWEGQLIPQVNILGFIVLAISAVEVLSVSPIWNKKWN